MARKISLLFALQNRKETCNSFKAELGSFADAKMLPVCSIRQVRYSWDTRDCSENDVLRDGIHLTVQGVKEISLFFVF